MLTPGALAVDFGGTLGRPGPRPDGRTVAAVLSGSGGTVIPAGFPRAFESAAEMARQVSRSSCEQVPFELILRHAARECGAVLPDPQAAAEAVFAAVPDAEVDPAAAAALHALRSREGGMLVCVLACDTQRPETIRRATLRRAGIADCFDALVLSSTLGLRKPHPGFYAAVQQAARRPAEHICFVGDTLAKDVLAPREHGMMGVLVDPAGRPTGLDPEIGVVRHFADLPGFLADPGRSCCGS